MSDEDFRQLLDRMADFLSCVWAIAVGRKLTPDDVQELRDRLEKFFAPRR